MLQLSSSVFHMTPRPSSAHALNINLEITIPETPSLLPGGPWLAFFIKYANSLMWLLERQRVRLEPPHWSKAWGQELHPG